MIADPPLCRSCGASTISGAEDGLCPRCHSTLAESEGRTAETIRISSSAALSPEAGAVSSESSLPTARIRLGDYELIEEIARGGMGVVYKARQLSLNRVVAVKMILHGQFANAEFVQRFRAEAEAAARLQHPNIVAIYEVGEVDGQHFFSMEYINGRDLASLVREQPLPAKRAADYVRTVAEAIHYAHQHGILHRDLKPSNVLLDAEGEVRVMDFGLAKRLSSDDLTPASTPGGLTLSGQVLGSPNYMSPEQAAGKSRTVTVCSDVYSLGAVLYHLIAGRPPFMAETIEATLLQVMQLDAPPPRLLNPTVPRDLETICLKCLEKDPARRYGSARAMADELTRFIEDKPVRARPVTRPEKIWRWCKRHPLDAALGAVTALLVGAITIGSMVAALRIDKARRESVKNAAESKERLRRLNVATGIRAMDSGDLLGALPWLVNALALERTNSISENISRRRIGALLVAAPQLEQVWSVGEALHSAAFSPNDQQIVVLTEGNNSRHALFASAMNGWKLVEFTNANEGVREVIFSPNSSRVAVLTKHYLHLLDESLRPVRKPFGEMESLRSACFSRDGRFLYVAGYLGSTNLILTLNVATGEDTGLKWECAEKPSHIRLSPDGARMLVVGDRRVWVHDATSGEQLLPAIEHRKPVLEAKFNFDGHRIVTASQDGTARIHTETNGEWQTIILPGGDVWMMSADFSPDGRLVATATDTGVARIWDTETGAPLTAPMRHTHSIRHIRFSPDGESLVTSSFDHTARIWDAHSGESVLSALRHNGYVADAVFSADGSHLLTAGQDGIVRLWRFSTKLFQWSLLHTNRFRSLEFSPDGSLLVVSDQRGSIQIRETETGQLRASAEQFAPFTSHPVFSPDGTTFATGGSDGNVVLRSVTNAQPLFGPFHHRRAIDKVAFSPAGDRIVVTSRDLAAQVWDVRSGKPVGEPLRHEKKMHSAVFSPDGKKVATGSDDHSAQIWDADTGQRIGAPLMHDCEVVEVRFSPDGTKLLTACSDQSFAARAAHLWDVATGQETVPPMRHTDGVETIDFSPDGSRIATGSEDGTVCVWDATTGRRVAPPIQHLSYHVAYVQFVAEGHVLFSVGRDGLVRLWDPTTGHPLTPRVAEERNLDAADVTADGRYIAYGSRDGRLMLYRFPLESRSVEELLRLSERLTSWHLDPEVGLMPAVLEHLTNGPSAPTPFSALK